MADVGPQIDGDRDERLLERYRQGEVGAFERLIERYRLEVFHFLVRFVRDRAAAEDLFQETFLQIHLSAESFDTDRRFKPWLFTIAANKARDHLRRSIRRSAAPLSASVTGGRSGGGSGGGGDEGASFVDLMQADVPQPADQAAAAELGHRVRAVVDQMPEHLREVLTLAYFQQLPYKEIAQALEVPLGTVKSRLHAAVAHFGSAWKKVSEENPDER
jgi:RNA polymerase sigma-70 factor (ECF subfamily)